MSKEQTNHIIGKTVEYTNRNQTLSGVVVDSIMMLQNDSTKKDVTPVPQPVIISGYMIINSVDNLIYPIAYWRITRIL